MASVISHKFIDLDEKESKQSSNDFNNNKTAIVLVGTTGTGKSSLISLYSDSAEVGHSVDSATKESSICSDNEERSWLDSQGANDSSGVDDEKVLTDVLKKLYDQKITNIKVIWCVSGDMDRKKDEFQTQSGFIKNGLGNKNNSIWNCCLIVKKKATLRPKRDMDGVLAAAKDDGANIGYGDDRIIGFSYYDPNKIVMTDQLEIIFDITDEGSVMRQNALKKAGYLTRAEVKQEINQRLSKLKSLKITFTIRKCEKCGCKGDERFIYEPCHTEQEKVHTGLVKRYHPQDRTSSNYHSGSWTTDRYHSSGTISYRYFLFDSWSWGSKHKCCGKDEGSSGCESNSYYSCCNSTSSYGCCTRYYYPCCGNDDTGCEDRWSCCHQSQGSIGCKTRCSNAECHKTWGTGPGCIKTSKKK